MPKLSLFKPTFMRRTLANRRRRAASRIQSAWRGRRRRGFHLFRKPHAGGQQLAIPLKCGYQYRLTGADTTTIAIDQDIGLQYMVSEWYTRYSALFQWIRINKCRIEISCPYNIGQHDVSAGSLYRVWSKKAGTTAEVPPSSNNEWLNMQNAKRSTFSGRNNSVNYYFTPSFQDQAGPIANTYQQKQMYKQWMIVPTGSGVAVPHQGIIAHIVRVDGTNISDTTHFNVNVTLYCQVKGLKQL